MVNDPLPLLACVMPCGGAAAGRGPSGERAKSRPHPAVYLLGVGAGVSARDALWPGPRMTTTPVVLSARRADEMAGDGPQAIQVTACYDGYTRRGAVRREEAGCRKPGESGPCSDAVDPTGKGRLPVQTDGGQISAGPPVGGAGGVRHGIEPARQGMGRAGGRQVATHDLGMVNG